MPQSSKTNFVQIFAGPATLQHGFVCNSSNLANTTRMEISLVGSTESSDFSKHGDVVMKMRAGAHSFAEV